MTHDARPRIRFGIRSKLFVAALSLLVIPWIGARYIQEIESFLREQQETLLTSRAQMLAAVLQGQPEVFVTETDAPLALRGVTHVYVRPLEAAIQLDGYLDDWRRYEQRMQYFGPDQALKAGEDASLAFHHQLGTHGRYVYAIFRIEDEHIVYRHPNSRRLDQSDRLIIAMQNRQGEFRRYILTTLAPGWVNAQRIIRDGREPRYEDELRIKGEWQETAAGYNIELRIPLSMLGEKLSFAVADVDDRQSRHTQTLIATAGIDRIATLGTIVVPSPQVEAILQRLQYPNTRTWVIDKHYRVVGRSGSLTDNTGRLRRLTGAAAGDEARPTFFGGLMQLVYRVLLEQPTTEFQDELLTASRLDTAEFRTALAGDSVSRWRQTPDRRVNILTAVAPVHHEGRVIGAVAIEQTSNSVLLLQNRAFEFLINLSLVAFLIAAVILLIFASRLSWRVRRLRNNAERAITSDGRVIGHIHTTRDRDEIGDLSRSFAEVLQRLANYNRYLETMAGKLSHELRTPITVVQSSLDNLALHPPSEEADTYVQRAREGLERLNNILTRMSEATRLEQTIQTEPLQPVDLAAVIEGCIHGYRLAHPQVEFTVERPEQSVYIQGSADLIAQMLDKLINNALDFHTPNTPIDTRLTLQADAAVLEVVNQGPPLPEQMQHNLFDSMVSVRPKRLEQPHLGLGLYIVRMIVDFHGGSVRAANLPHGAGVSLRITLPHAALS